MNKDKFSPRFTELMQRAETRCIGFSHSASEWSEIMEALDEFWITDERITKEYELGRKIGWENCVTRVGKDLLDIATAYFHEGKDDTARQYRDLSKMSQKALKLD